LAFCNAVWAKKTGMVSLSRSKKILWIHLDTVSQCDRCTDKYGLFVLKVPLNPTNQPAQTNSHVSIAWQYADVNNWTFQAQIICIMNDWEQVVGPEGTG